MSKKKCPNCGACPECGAQPPYVVRPYPLVPTPYPYVAPYTYPYPRATWIGGPGPSATFGVASSGSAKFANAVSH